MTGRPPPDDTLDQALGAWRADTERHAASLLARPGLADRIVASARPWRPLPPAGARVYAAAAAALLVFGLAGTWIVRAERGGALRSAPPRWAGVEEAIVDLLAKDPRYAPGLSQEGR